MFIKTSQIIVYKKRWDENSYQAILIIKYIYILKLKKKSAKKKNVINEYFILFLYIIFFIIVIYMSILIKIYYVIALWIKNLKKSPFIYIL